MRLAIALAAMASLGLPGSGAGASTTGAPPSTGYAVGEISVPAQTDMRTSQINACVADSPVRLPAGTNTNLVCSCAVDKMLASDATQGDAILQCAVRMHASVTELRASEVSGCVGGAADHLPTGTDADAFCTCAVDKMLTHSTPQLDAVNQCATQMHITLRDMD